LSHCGEESTPLRCARRVLGLVHSAWGSGKEIYIDIIHHQRPNLKEAAGCSGETLKYDKTMNSSETATKSAK
jgi:hypothetical protein